MFRAAIPHRFGLPFSASSELNPPAKKPARAVSEGGRERREYFLRISLAREYVEVIGVIAGVTMVGWFVPMTYHTFGFVYLLAVILLSLRVGRWPVLVAAITSALAWNCVFVPPQLSFTVVDADDNLMLGTYLAVALVAGQLTARIRAQEREERVRERRATALFHLTRALVEARTLDEAVEAALWQADHHFMAQTALLLPGADGVLVPHPAGSFDVTDRERGVAAWVWQHRVEAGRFTAAQPSGAGSHIPLLRAGNIFGVFAVRLPADTEELAAAQREVLDGFAAQIALLVEREQLRTASEREKFFAESDRLHRTLLDSVSHELKTPLSVLRSAGVKLDTDDGKKRAALVHEICTATSRLDHLVANLLNQTRLESGGLRPQLDWCDARDLIQAARRGVGDALAGRPFTSHAPADLPLFMADAPLMEQVIVNLLRNAALHTPAGTAILVTAGTEVRNEHTRVFIRVEDRGSGIPPELRENLFQKFRRGRAARAGGLGLGLSIVRGFMLAQGGDVIAGDNPAGGASFTVFLPFVPHGSIPNDER